MQKGVSSKSKVVSPEKQSAVRSQQSEPTTFIEEGSLTIIQHFHFNATVGTDNKHCIEITFVNGKFEHVKCESQLDERKGWQLKKEIALKIEQIERVISTVDQNFNIK